MISAKQVFAAHKPVSARIARRRNERSKGFGFVEFPSKKEQTAALALDQHTIEDRQITVKVSWNLFKNVFGFKFFSSVQVSMVGDDRKEGGERKTENKASGNKGGNNNNAGNNNNKKERAPRQQQEKKEGSSSSTIYVSNLPFDLTDDSLAEVFRSKVGKRRKRMIKNVLQFRQGTQPRFCSHCSSPRRSQQGIRLCGVCQPGAAVGCAQGKKKKSLNDFVFPHQSC